MLTNTPTTAEEEEAEGGKAAGMMCRGRKTQKSCDGQKNGMHAEVARPCGEERVGE